MMTETINVDIQNLIRKYLYDKNINENKCDVSSTSHENIYFISKIFEVDISEQNNCGETRNFYFFVKMAKDHQEFRVITSIREMYLNEIYFYKTIVPHLVAIQEQKKVVNQFKSYPNFYISSDENLKEIIILNNLRKNGFKMNDRHMMLDYEHALLTMKELGRFHALSFAMRHYLPEVFKEILCKPKDLEYHHGYGETMELFLQEFFILADKILIDRNSVCEKLNIIKRDFFNIVKQAIEPQSAEPYAVLNHGDFWISNLLFKYDESSRPTELCIVDFQSIKMCSPASDISQFIFTCLTPEVRKKYRRNLISEYYNSLSSFLREFGVDPEQLFPFHILQDQLKKFSVIGLYFAFKLIAVRSIDSEHIPKFDESPDSSTFVRLFIDAKRDVNYFSTTIQEVILHYSDFGYCH